MKNKSIAVFDSGVGGLSVLQHLLRLLPNEDFIYFGDSANAPYGTRSTEEVRTLTMAAAEKLMERGIKALVVACNTATAAAIGQLRQRYPDRIIIGIEPALKPAVERFPEGRIGIMATQVTLREEKLAHQMERFPRAKLERICVPGLVELVEQGKGVSSAARELLEPVLGPYRGKLDALVLGCTHYPFAAESIAAVLGPDTVLLDGGEGTARQTRRCLVEAGLLREEGPGSVTLDNSLESGRILEICEILLEEEA